jgi:deoxyribose-phosphate aldolase
MDCVYADVDYVKTSTGLTGGATVRDVQTMREATKGYGTKIKASGGIKTYGDVAKFLDMGVQRIGSSSYTELCYNE